MGISVVYTAVRIRVNTEEVITRYIVVFSLIFLVLIFINLYTQ